MNKNIQMHISKILPSSPSSSLSSSPQFIPKYYTKFYLDNIHFNSIYKRFNFILFALICFFIFIFIYIKKGVLKKITI